jgi:hypothetical protein
MAISLNTADTHIVLTALQIYREQELEAPENEWRLHQIERLIKSYKRSFAALSRLDKI